MQVMDIVNRAAMNCGVASSFNPDEVPEDIQARGSDILRHEIIPMMNCDRTLDITEIVYPVTPQNRCVSLITPPTDSDIFIMGQVAEDYRTLNERQSILIGSDTKWYCPKIRAILINHGYIEASTPTLEPKTAKWPCNQFENEYRDVYCWTSDFKLIKMATQVSSGNEDDELLDKRYNIPFSPMRVEGVFRACDGAELLYLHAAEMVSAEFRNSQLVYGVEDLPDRMLIRLNRSYGSEPLLLVLPIPLKIVNTFDNPRPWEGTIIAPEKFRSFLIAKLAYRLAIEYGLDTAPSMAKLVEESYQAIIKNISKRHHAQNIPRKIADYLQRGYSRGNMYGGGYGNGRL